ncbi:2-hydroxychromene-2-carboxylate isomerase [Variovorax sp. PAMC 28711]|uniref:2-hydroxychromene-2-carboxylate isomerase n=1 Tax=Variovorax sp. PAMC 28711 TaxID=1795631 RepID=UPI00078D9204|nr:2-hydroxychromene-2-carboxylate isomerase [Variovorax sp. PAMC 28711]AMM23756.1 hypothetical protein AX767_04905 [Variovorax sp. PAMC 28711]
MTPFDFYFDYRSPYSYLAFTQFRTLAGRARFKPFDIVDVMQRTGNVPTSVVCAAKNRYVRTDLLRWATHYQVRLVRHARAAHIDTRRLLRATLAAGLEREQGSAIAAEALFNAFWRDNTALEGVEDVAAVLAAAGLDGHALEGLMDDPATDSDLNTRSAEAAELGVFGAPSFVVGAAMYFGNDRLDFLRQHLASKP